jgi:hypothetical protein
LPWPRRAAPRTACRASNCRRYDALETTSRPAIDPLSNATLGDPPFSGRMLRRMLRMRWLHSPCCAPSGARATGSKGSGSTRVWPRVRCQGAGWTPYGGNCVLARGRMGSLVCDPKHRGHGKVDLATIEYNPDPRAAGYSPGRRPRIETIAGEGGRNGLQGSRRARPRPGPWRCERSGGRG